MKKVKALVLFSGGLDSILAAKILAEQGIEIVPVYFKSYFFGPEIAKKSAKENGFELKIVDISKEHLKIVKNPKFGYGKGANPCLDCHILMLKKAKEIMKKENFNFIATGEVLGERPFSQNKKALEIVEKESSLTRYLLRPLSARLLRKTVPEIKGWVDREKLFDISGRRRKRQMELAKRFRIKWYPTPAGGCLLTDPEFAKRLMRLMENYPKFEGNDIDLLKVGRHFWEGKTKIVVGRSKDENLKLKKLAKKKDILVEMKNYIGPTTLIRNYAKGKIGKKILEKAKKLTKSYSKKSKGQKDVEFELKKIEF
jgi:tRNA U34 2-thiouridine synthase MnmA/TrmU